MKGSNQEKLNLKLLDKGPVPESELNWPLMADVKYIVNEGPCIRIGFNVHATTGDDYSFEDRIWDPKFIPDHKIPPNLKISISLSKRNSKKRLQRWSRILDMKLEDTYDYMKKCDILKGRDIQLSVNVCKGTNDIQYIVIVASRVFEKKDELWSIDEKPAEIPENELICLQGMWNQEDYEKGEIW